MQAKKAHSIDKQNRFPLNHSMDLDGLNIMIKIDLWDL